VYVVALERDEEFDQPPEAGWFWQWLLQFVNPLQPSALCLMGHIICCRLNATAFTACGNTNMSPCLQESCQHL
jgi:hypothetical protein